jgi:hypothetical protein
MLVLRRLLNSVYGALQHFLSPSRSGLLLLPAVLAVGRHLPGSVLSGRFLSFFASHRFRLALLSLLFHALIHLPL